MAIDDLLHGITGSVRKVHDYFSVPGSSKKMADYAFRNYVDKDTADSLFDGKSEDEIKATYSLLEEKINLHLDTAKNSLNKLTSKAAKGTGLLALLNSAYNTFRGPDFEGFIYGYNFLVGAKALLELPAMYSHVKNTHDFYGAMEWIMTKPLAYLIPIIGPLIDLDVTKRIIRKKVIKDALNDFLKEKGLYKAKEPLYKRIYDRIKSLPEEPAPTPA